MYGSPFLLFSASQRKNKIDENIALIENNIPVVCHNHEKESLDYELKEHHVVLWKRKLFID